MDFIFSNITVLLILAFFIITYFFSIVEKVSNWTATLQFYENHFKGTFVLKKLNYLIYLVLFFESVSLFLLVLGFYSLAFLQVFTFIKLALITSSITLLILLIGQRIAKDYAGSMSITVYFILNSIGIYILT